METLDADIDALGWAGASVTPPKRIGDGLLDAGVITSEQLRVATAEAQRTGELFGQVLVRLGFVTPDHVVQALAEQAGVPLVDLEQYPVDYDLLQTVPEEFLRKHRLVPIKREGFTLTAASSNPTNLAAVDDLQKLTELFVTVVAAKESQLRALLDKVFAKPKTAQSAPATVAASGAGAEMAAVGDPEDSSVVRLVDDFFRKAAQEAATDIHIEPEENSLVTRFRYDGFLQPGLVLPRALLPGIVTRIKILGNMNISESRLPQDGRIQYRFGDKRLELRVSSFPTVNGESLAIRVLDKTRSFGIDTLGLSGPHKTLFKRLIARPHGLLLVTGPTGSGKTTTLYSALVEINSVDRNIMTLEDPVEYELPRVRQGQINPRSGFTFATGLRAILRHDPDVILVGEMRDSETMEITIRSALTGHLVFSTLHTNDALGAIPRLVDMGAEPYLIASSLLGVLAQRLVRVICQSCRVEADHDQAGVARLGAAGSDLTKVFVGKGCTLCNFTGYRGRTAVFEFVELTLPLADLITQRAEPEALRRQARKDGMEPMFQDALSKVKAGVTTVDELIRAIQAVE